MKKITSILLAAFFGLAMFAGAMPAPASAQMSIGVRIGPMPPARYEAVPPPPGRYYHWDAGHWQAMNGRWAWVPGHYVHGYSGGRWVPGHYNRNNMWIPGHYR